MSSPIAIQVATCNELNINGNYVMRLLEDLYETKMFEHRCNLYVVTFCDFENLKNKQNESIQKIQMTVSLTMHNILFLTLVVGYIGLYLDEK